MDRNTEKRRPGEDVGSAWSDVTTSQGMPRAPAATRSQGRLPGLSRGLQVESHPVDTWTPIAASGVWESKLLFFTSPSLQSFATTALGN